MHLGLLFLVFAKSKFKTVCTERP